MLKWSLRVYGLGQVRFAYNESKFSFNPKFNLIIPDEPNFWVKLDLEKVQYHVVWGWS